MSVHIVVVNWNGLADTRSCLDNLETCAGDAVVHVVDNGSTDGSAAAMADEYPDVRLHALDENRGFSGGVNVGLRAALEDGATWILLMNNDATLAPGALAALLMAGSRHPSAGLFGGRIYQDRAADRLWCCGVGMGWWPNLCRLRGHGKAGAGRYLKEERVDGLTGCGLLVRREVFDRVGLLDEEWFVYVEDADLCARARKAGFDSVYVPGAVLEHAGAGSTGGGYSRGRKYLTAYGSVLYLRRHGTLLLWLGFVCVDLLMWPLLFVISVPTGRIGGAFAKLRGMIDGFLGRPIDKGVLSQAEASS